MKSIKHLEDQTSTSVTLAHCNSPTRRRRDDISKRLPSQGNIKLNFTLFPYSAATKGRGPRNHEAAHLLHPARRRDSWEGRSPAALIFTTQPSVICVHMQCVNALSHCLTNTRGLWLPATAVRQTRGEEEGAIEEGVRKLACVCLLHTPGGTMHTVYARLPSPVSKHIMFLAVSWKCQ